MKKFNKNILVFVFCMLFVGVGLCSGDFFAETKSAFDNLINGKSSKLSRIAKFEKKIDSVSAEELSYHSAAMNLNSVLENIKGTRIIKKAYGTYIKSDSESLYQTGKRFTDKQIETTIERVNELYQFCNKNDADFLYVFAPCKGDYYSSPSNINNYSKTNYYHYINEMKEKNIPVLDFEERFKNLKPEEIFYYTDHHWTTRMGFYACKEICHELENRYDYLFDDSLFDLSKYNSTTRKNILLGSYGREVGTYFSWNGADDLEYIYPNFQTKLSNNIVSKDECYEGDFTSSISNINKLDVKDYYKEDPYYVYLGGDYRLQIIKNHLNNNGKKLLIIRDSFGVPVVPFLSLNMRETHIVDIRNGEQYAGDKVNVYEYIKSINPDYVLILYSGADYIDSGTGRFNFE